MGARGRLAFLLLLLLGAPGMFVRPTALPNLPRVVTLSEDAAPGTRVAEVTVSCSTAQGSPNVTLLCIEPRAPNAPTAPSVTPCTPEPGHPFNPIAISAVGTPATTFRAEVTLRAGAELDAHRVNQYTLVLRAACPGEEEVTGWLFVWVTAGQVLRCDAPFTSAGGDVVRVPADVAPHAPLHAVLPQPLGGLMTFRLDIEVTDQHGHNCSGAVTVEVLPSRRPRVTILEPQWDVTVPEGSGPLEVVTQVRASGDNVHYAILSPVVPALFTIDEMTGEIRSTSRLEVAHVRLLVRAYNALQPADQATATINVTVQGRDRQAPSCVPALYVTQVRETVSPGSTLVTLRCTSPAGAEGSLSYALEGPPGSHSRFRMEGPQLQVNTTLDYDSQAMAALGFQLTATIVVTAGGQPPRSTRVPVLVTVTPVNEFSPECPRGLTFTVLETASFGSVVGYVNGTDRDYPPDSLEYSLEGGSSPTQPFSIDTHSGEIRVVGSLGSPQRTSYRLPVWLTDTHNDLDPATQRKRPCTVTVRLQAVPEPRCTPEVQELRITAGRGGRQPITQLACRSDPDTAALSYTIAGGNEDGRFRLDGSTLSYIPDGLAEPRTFVLLVEVRGGPGASRSTVVAVVVHVTPRSTTVPPSTTTRRTTPRKEPLVVMRMVAVWHPPAWFVAVLTVAGVLLLASLGCLARSIACSSRAPSKPLPGESSSRAVTERSGGREERGGPQAGRLAPLHTGAI
ncbi:cadherin-related family member 4 isoform X5 [Anas acuta]|uniref:cadherin-related family member 4 isoform X5 n=1 Tax=Anas acuta TaxID=28680 RepID=UPI0035C939D6